MRATNLPDPPKKPVIRRVREALGLTQEAFARDLGRSYAAIRTYEAGRKAPLDVMARAMAMCARAGLIDLSNEVQEAAVGKIEREGAEVASASAIHLHSLLDRVIRFGDADTLLAAARFLEMAAYWISAGRSQILARRAVENYDGRSKQEVFAEINAAAKSSPPAEAEIEVREQVFKALRKTEKRAKPQKNRRKRPTR